jgi:hypothetical protein
MENIQMPANYVLTFPLNEILSQVFPEKILGDGEFKYEIKGYPPKYILIRGSHKGITTVGRFTIDENGGLHPLEKTRHITQEMRHTVIRLVESGASKQDIRDLFSVTYPEICRMLK